MQFFSDRLANRVPLEQLFWRDMIMYGTTLNFTFLVCALALAATDWPTWAAFLVFLIPLPYNVFIWHCVWNAANRLDVFPRVTLRSIATGWLLLVIIL
ncbi:hypothetical protein DUT91_16610 [Phyllobacterium salinisoli]|uniref:Uncharacterized protein n=2 Tax=Phyllobacterium salinisoli TaxID=1899321 RepID=A0A368JZI2_9HYPH|nr:hypothetical protein DUT91_16610 [Phyllobacterium salinisoli]